MYKLLEFSLTLIILLSKGTFMFSSRFNNGPVLIESSGTLSIYITNKEHSNLLCKQYVNTAAPNPVIKFGGSSICNGNSFAQSVESMRIKEGGLVLKSEFL